MNTLYGFKWGPIEVKRIASNDGKDKRAKFWALGVETAKEQVTIECDVKGNIVIVRRVANPNPLEGHEVGCKYIHADGEGCITDEP